MLREVLSDGPEPLTRYACSGTGLAINRRTTSLRAHRLTGARNSGHIVLLVLWRGIWDAVRTYWRTTIEVVSIPFLYH